MGSAVSSLTIRLDCLWLSLSDIILIVLLLLVIVVLVDGVGDLWSWGGWEWLDLDWSLEELVQDLIDLTVEDLTGNEGVLVTPILLVLLWHHGDVVNKNFQLVVIEILDEFIVVVFELLKAVVIVKQLVNGAILVAQ
jgi:hypothetical protein